MNVRISEILEEMKAKNLIKDYQFIDNFTTIIVHKL